MRQPPALPLIVALIVGLAGSSTACPRRQEVLSADERLAVTGAEFDVADATVGATEDDLRPEATDTLLRIARSKPCATYTTSDDGTRTIVQVLQDNARILGRQRPELASRLSTEAAKHTCP